MRNRIKRNLAFLLATLMTITTVFGNVSLSAVAEEQRTTIAAFNYSADVVFPAGITDGTSAGTLLDIVGATRNGFSSDGLSAIEWTSGGYWLVKDIDASNFSNMVVNAKLRTSNTSSSVLYYNLQYSLDNENWNTLFVTEALSKSLANRIKNVTLPEQLANNTFSLRFLACDGEGNACAPSNSGGTSQINNIVISGIYTGEEPPVIVEKCQSVTTASTVRYGEAFSDTVKLECETKDATIFYSFNKENGFNAYTGPFAVNAATTVYAYASKSGFEDSAIAELEIAQTKCAKPGADVQSQAEVEAEQKITLSCKTEGATILYKFDGEEFREYTEPISLPAGVEAPHLQAKATCDGCLESGTAGFYYTVKESTIIPPEPVSYTLSSVSDGDCFYLYSNSGKQVLTSTMSGKKLSGVSGEIDEEGKLLVEKTNDNASLVDSLVKLTAKVNAEGFYTFVSKDASDNDVFLTCPATGNGLSLNREESEYSLWKVDVSDNDILIGSKSAIYTDKYDVSHKDYIEFYNSFTTYSYDEGTTDPTAYSFSLFKNVEIKDSTTVIDDDDDDESNSNRLSELKDGDLVIMEINGNVLSEEADGKVLKGIAATAGEDGVLEAPEKAAYLKVVVNSDDNTIAFKNAVSGQYLVTGETGSTLSFEDSITGLSSWTLEAQEGGFYVKNKDAKYSGTTPQYLEFYKGFTTYSLKNGGVAYLTNFYKVSLPVMADTSVTKTVAQWAGNANYEAEGLANEIPGDLFATNDLKDSSAKYTAVVSGIKVDAYTKSTSTQTGSTSYYMGATGVGSGTNDYLQFELSSLGYANMKMAFRLRASNTGAGEYTLKYSTDGEKFENFTTGSYSCSYTQYRSDGSSENVTKEGDITNGIAKASISPANYVSFSFDVPKGASNADKLYIRLCPGKTQAKGSEAPTTSGTVRIDSVVITGNPVIDESACSYVKATPDSGTIAKGEGITLSTSTDDAKIFYSLNENEFVEYTEDGVIISELPATLVAYAAKDGVKDSAKTVYFYSQAQCEPVKATPNGGAVVKGTKVTLRDNTEGVKILYRLSDTEVWTEYTEPFTLDEVPCTYYVKASKEGFIDSPQGTLDFTERTNEKYNIYFGQIHSHTTISDGAGSLEEAFKHAKGVANLDYIVVTDHSNSFDGADKGDITKNTDSAETDEWTYAHKLAEEMSDDEFTCMYGYEMTWSNGLGHMNTYNTEGFQSRTQTDYSTYSTALNNYYTALEKVPDSISMFNHPGTTFGDFQDFAYFSEARDNLINLIEVGNGEGAIGSSGYFPSYEYYTRALDKGWHVAPTNNQDNHKGLWGDANTARTVALCDKNAELDYYDAMRNHRVYATEDNDLSIYYTLDGYIMGSILSEDETGDTVKLVAELSDPTDSSIGKISVIVNGGLEIASKDVTSNKETVTFEVPNNYSYYYLKIVEKDGDIAVTAPVWTGDVEACGISSVTTTTALPVSGDPIDINLELYNNEKSALTVNAIAIDLLDAEGVSSHIETIEGDELGEVKEVVSNGTLSYSFENVYEGAGNVTYEITVNASLNGVEKVYTGKLSANYVVPAMVGDIIIDGTHNNDYVYGGYYTENMGNFCELAADYNLKAKVITNKIDAETLKNCRLMVISAPAAEPTGKYAGTYEEAFFDDDFISTVAEYVNNGGSIIICGLADYNNYHAGAEQNKLLDAIGSTIRVNSDEAVDDTNHGGSEKENYRLYPENFNMDSEFMKGVIAKEDNADKYQIYSQYSGCTIDISNADENEKVYAAEAMVSGFDTTYSKDCKDESGKTIDTVLNNMGNVTFLAHQATKAGGNIFVAGAVMVSNYEVKAEMDNNDSLPYANYTIAQNILSSCEIELQTSDISEVRRGNTGDVYSIEGYVTSGTANANTTFFDTIYVQDATGGIDIFPYAENGLELGTKVKVTGYVSAYQGDKELKVISVKILEDAPVLFDPLELSTEQAMDYDTYGGSLLKTTGTVTRLELNESGELAEFWLNDDSGKEAAIFIDGYIRSATTGRNDLANTVKVGATVSAVGVLYMHPEGSSDVSVPVFRVRNCDEINVIKAAPLTPSQPASDDHSSDSHSSEPTVTPAKETPSLAPANEQVVAVPGRAIAGNTTVANEKVEASDVQNVETNEDNDKLEEKEITDELSPKSDAAGLTDDENAIIGGEQTPMASEAPKQANSLGIIFVIVGCALALTVCIFAVYKKKGMKKEN